MDDEQQCEDALFVLCDARERYPLYCANELQKSIKFRNDINMLKTFQISSVINTLEQNEYVDLNSNEDKCFDHMDFKLQNIIKKLNNLKAVMDQIEREKTCCTNKLLEG